MSEQDKVPENSIPPKETPFAKAPESGAPVSSGTGTPPRRTSRIPLGEMSVSNQPAAPSAEQPRTVRLRPVASVKPVAPATPAPATDGVTAQAAKSKTSRISLDSAISGATTTAPTVQPAASPSLEQQASEPPKTIRLKRPTEMPTVKVQSVPPPAGAGGPTPVRPPIATSPINATSPIPGIPLRATAPIPPIGGGGSGHNQTARITAEPPASSSDNAPITQKRTIRVKRPSSISVSRPVTDDSDDAAMDSDSESAAMVEPMAPSVAPDTANPVFIIAAILIMFVSIGLAVVFASQIFGPNASLTELSIWPTGPDFPLPGTVSGN